MSQIIKIQFSKAGKLYDFDAGEFELLQGDYVIVETERGVGMGEVVKPPIEKASSSEELAKITRKATVEDFAILKSNNQKEKEAFSLCASRIIDRNMQMKLVKVEYQFDGSKAIFYFTADGRVDFRELVKDLAHAFHTRIEMRQIGVRDEAKMTGGIAICGRELCCSKFLREFQPVSVKMAKEQNLALNPNKISGQCGRLLCCLDYEYEAYCCLRKEFPKPGRFVRSANVSGVIDKVNILTGDITLKIEDNKFVTIKRDEILGEGVQQPVVSTVITEVVQSPPLLPPPAPTPVRTPQRPPEKNRDRRNDPKRKQEKRSLESYTNDEAAKALQKEIVLPPIKPVLQPPVKPVTPSVKPVQQPASAESGKPANQQQRKKNRSRNHGHRRPTEKNDGNKPTPPSGD